MFKTPKPEFTPEFRKLSVKRVRSGMTIGAVAKALGLLEQMLRNGVKAAERRKLNPAGARRNRWNCRACGRRMPDSGWSAKP